MLILGNGDPGWTRDAITAALSDPEDPDSLARTLYLLNAGLARWSEPAEVRLWQRSSEATRVHWRAVADGLRMMLTGQGS